MSAVAVKPAVPLLRLDPWLAGSALVLALLGAVMVASASITMADRVFGQPFYYLLRQLMYLGAGGLAAACCMLLPLRAWEQASPLLLAAAGLLLAAVFVPGLGYEVNGATRWLRVGPFNLQAAEPARLLLVIYLCSYVARRRDALEAGFKGLLFPLVIVTAAGTMLMLQPDFGATVVLFATAIGVLFVGGMRLGYLLLMGVAGFASLAALVLTSEYRMRRLTAFLDPWADPWNSGFQLTQSLIAIARGEWFGVGLGGSVQKLFYLPEAHTDFVFAVFAEEFGLLGVFVMIALFAVLLWRAYTISAAAAAAGRVFAACLAFGLATWIGLQAFINIAVNMGLLPTKGLTLPLVSYGGSSLLVTGASVGLLLRIHYELSADGYAGRRAARGRK
ncbi:MAG TPA: putative lipid II flippase FtsW [Gammaproteobacteria bacterium]|nr:putative lipid II flippase FtsW [Gammaproteobacteria bacterium]